MRTELPEPTSPLFRAPGEDMPVIEPPLDASVAVRIDAPESPSDRERRIAQLAEGRATRIQNLADEDADIRVVATALKTRGYSVAVIAERLAVTSARVRRCLKQARLDGNLHDVLADLNAEALPLAMEKLIDSLEAGAPWAIQQTLKGGGVFRQFAHQEAPGAREARTLDVTFVMPSLPQAMDARGIVGAPRVEIGEVIDAAVSTVRVEEAAAEAPRAGVGGEVVGGGDSREGRGDQAPAGRVHESALVRAVLATRGE